MDTIFETPFIVFGWQTKDIRTAGAAQDLHFLKSSWTCISQWTIIWIVFFCFTIKQPEFYVDINKMYRKVNQINNANHTEFRNPWFKIKIMNF